MKTVTIATLLAVASSASAQTPTIGKCPVFPGNNIWNTRIDSLPVSPNSETWVNTIGANSPLHPDFGSGTYNGAPIGIPVVTVSGTQTKYPATFQYADQSDPGPYAVPLNAPIEGGPNGTGDRHAIAVDDVNCIDYELFAAYPSTPPPSWLAGSGAIFNLKSDALRPNGWTSADAAGLPIFPGLLRYDEILNGQINHALRFTAPQTQNAWVWPARHEASSIGSTQYPPMGARFRLNASFDISKFSAIDQIILTALKKYGMMLADNGSAWYISGEPDSRWNNSDLHFLTGLTGSDFEAVDVSALIVNVNSGQAALPAISVSVTPATATLAKDQSTQFGAKVTGSADQSVTWSVNAVAGGNSKLGTISANGLYTAPKKAPADAVTIHADSVAGKVSGTASVTVK